MSESESNHVGISIADMEEKVKHPYGPKSTIAWLHYDKVRPTYPDQIYNTIADYMNQHNVTDRKLCIDYGCGSGTAVPGLFMRCGIDKILGVDFNSQILEDAKMKIYQVYSEDRFDTLVGEAGSIDSIQDKSAALVTAAEAIHWFDQPRWVKEAARVLQPSGTLAFWLYKPQCFIIEPAQAARACNEAFERYFDIGVHKDNLTINQVLCSTTLLDNVVVDPELFSEQARYKWLVPQTVSELIDRDAVLIAIESQFPKELEQAGLNATPDARIEVSTPRIAQQMVMRKEHWSTTTLIQYFETLGMKTEIMLEDEKFAQCLKDIESIAGQPNGRFTVGWEIALVLATARH